MMRWIACSLLLVSSQWMVKAEHSVDEAPSLSVTGRAEIRVVPDQAVIQLGVREEAVTAREAQTNVNRTIQKILDALATLNIDPEQIQTSQLSLQPVYGDARNRREAGEPRIIGYNASYTLSVRTKELTQVSSVIDAALEAGANQLRGVGFGLDDEKSAQQEALRAAVADAMEKAKVLAQAAETQLLRILTIVEGGAVVRPAMMARTAVMAAEVGGAPTPVMAGQVTVSAQVTIRYLICED